MGERGAAQLAEIRPRSGWDPFRLSVVHLIASTREGYPRSHQLTILNIGVFPLKYR